MLEFVQPEDLNEADQIALVTSLSAATPWHREDPEIIWGELRAGLIAAFRYKNAFIAVKRLYQEGETRLSLVAVHDPSGHFGRTVRGFTADLRRLAAEWECDKIETTCYSADVAKVVRAMGAHVESVTMVIDLKGSTDGQ